MTTEQKAKAYDEAIERANASYKDEDRHLKATLERIFPELKESEDEWVEKIKKDIISYLNNRQITSIVESNATEKWIAWLEKQGMQKTVRSEEDERMYRGLHNLIYVVHNCDCDSKEKLEFSNWLKSLKDRVQPEQEWSKEDKEIVEALNDYVKNLDILFSEIKIGDKDILSKEFREKVQLWLKSLRPQKQWKPSDEQLKSLEHFVRSVGESGYASPYDNNTKLIYSLLEQLKQL